MKDDRSAIVEMLTAAKIPYKIDYTKTTIKVARTSLAVEDPGRRLRGVYVFFLFGKHGNLKNIGALTDMRFK